MARPAGPCARRFTNAAAALIGLTVIAVGPSITSAWAHSELVSTLPSHSAQLNGAPVEVAFTFDKSLLLGTTTIAILDSSGKLLESREATPRGESIAVPWPTELRTGSYQVAYQGASGDGHPVSGSITFTIDGANGTTAPPSTVIAPAPAALLAAGLGTTQGTTASVFTAGLMAMGFLLLAAMAVGLSRVGHEKSV